MTIDLENIRESDVKDRIAQKPNLLVPWYLLCSISYYYLDTSLISDDLYDELCKKLDANYDKITHRHKKYIDRMALRAGTGYDVDPRRLPRIVTSTAWYLCGYQVSELYPEELVYEEKS